MITALEKKEFLTKYKETILSMQSELKELPQVPLPLLHDFSPGVYKRSILMPKDTFVIGKTHKTEHFNFVLTGSATVLINGELRFIQAPCSFKSVAGAKKVLYIHEEMVWETIHPTDETDLDKLEKLFVLSDQEEKESLKLELQQIKEL